MTILSLELVPEQMNLGLRFFAAKKAVSSQYVGKLKEYFREKPMYRLLLDQVLHFPENESLIIRPENLYSNSIVAMLHNQMMGKWGFRQN